MNVERGRMLRPDQVGAGYAAAVLFWLPLYLYSGYLRLIDGKAALFYALTAAGAVATVISLCLGARRRMVWDRSFAWLAGLCAVYGCGLLLSQDTAIAFWGLAGRDNGVMMLLMCAVCYGIVRCTVRAEDVPTLYAVFLAGACVVSVLGWMNYFGADPLDTYYTVDPQDAHIFLSTVGNINFFGGLMAVAAHVAIGLCLQAGQRRAAVAYGAVAALLTASLIPANSDGAWVGFSVALLCVLCAKKTTWRQVSRLFAVGAAVCAAGLAAGAASRLVAVRGQLRTFSALLCYPAVALAGLLCCALLALALRRAKGCCARICVPLAALVLLGVAALAVLVNIAGVSLGGLDGLLRFGPTWGSNRGYVWDRLIYLYFHELSLPQKIVGAGADSVDALLNPHYTQYIEALNGSTFDSAHNVYLQHLLCGGALGLFFWCAFWVRQLRTARRGQTVLTAALAAYCVQAFFSIDMPALLPLVFVLAGLASLPEESPARIRRDAVFYVASAAAGVVCMFLTPLISPFF